MSKLEKQMNTNIRVQEEEGFTHHEIAITEKRLVLHPMVIAQGAQGIRNLIVLSLLNM